MIRELFRGMEASLHERLTLIQELLDRNSNVPPQMGTIEQSLQIQRLDPALSDRLAKLESAMRKMEEGHAHLVKLFYSETKQMMSQMVETSLTFKQDIEDLRSDIRRLDAAQTAVVPSAEEVEDEIETEHHKAAPEVAEAEAAELDCDADNEEEEVEDEVEEEEANENGLYPLLYNGVTGKYFRDDDNDVFVETEDSYKQVGKWDPVAKTITFVEEEEEEEEEEEMSFKPIEYKGNTYYCDESTNLVYVADEDGGVDADMPVGRWNAQTKKITRLT